MSGAVIQKPLADLSAEEKRLLSSFYGFSRFFLGMDMADVAGDEVVAECRSPTGGELYYQVRRSDWQRRILNAADQHKSKVTAVTCNGAGKTSRIIPGMVLPFMALNPRAKVVITSGVDRQVREQVFPHLTSHVMKRLKGWDYSDTKITAPNGAHCVGFTTREGGHFEGWHGNPDQLYRLFEHDGPLMIIVDEAKSVARPIFHAIERCTHQHLALVSSAGGPEGEFYDSHHKAAGSYTARFQIPASVCPHVDHAKNADLIARRGLADALVRSKVFAEFMLDAGETVISRAAVDALRANPPQARRYGQADEVVFCDFAAGGDENTIGHRAGNVVRLVAAWTEKDTMKAVGQFILEFRRLGLRPEDAGRIYGDNDGLGRVMIDRLHELGWRIQRYSAADKAGREDEYLNRGSELWYEGAKKIAQREFVLEVDDQTAAQLAGRRGSVHASSGRLRVEPKEEHNHRQGYSPDRAEAILGAMLTVGAHVQQLSKDASPFEQFAEMHRGDGTLVAVPAGMDAG
jgi:hypothetical protein